MRQNFVLKKNEEKGKSIAQLIFLLIGVAFVFVFPIIAMDMGFSQMAQIYMLLGGISSIISFLICLSFNKEYHGYFAMEGFTIECRITKCVIFKGFTWDVRVNDISLPLIQNGNKAIKTYTCTINGTRNMEIIIFGFSVVAKIDGMPVIENDIVYVDKIKQILNI